MKYLIFPILIMSSFVILGQTQEQKFDPQNWKAPYKLIIPSGWNVERFQIPIEFAPSIKFVGVEDLRFTPGWGDSTSQEYWTYSYLWFLNGKQKLEAKMINENLKAYYTGLIGRNIEPRHIPQDKLFPVTTHFEEIETTPGDTNTFKGTVYMLDYMRQAPMTLNCLVHVKECPGKDNTFVFYEISPQELSHSVWGDMNRIWTAFRCDLN